MSSFVPPSPQIGRSNEIIVEDVCCNVVHATLHDLCHCWWLARGTTAKTSLGILLNAITCDKKASFGQRFHHHIYTIGQILDLQSLAERRLWKSAKKRIDALTPYLCHVVCLAMIVFVYEYMQWFSEEKKNSIEKRLQTIALSTRGLLKLGVRYKPWDTY